MYCPKCGFNLNDDNGVEVCPECGAKLRESTEKKEERAEAKTSNVFFIFDLLLLCSSGSLSHFFTGNSSEYGGCA